jgi:hypothetical protein
MKTLQHYSHEIPNEILARIQDMLGTDYVQSLPNPLGQVCFTVPNKKEHTMYVEFMVGFQHRVFKEEETLSEVMHIAYYALDTVSCSHGQGRAYGFNGKNYSHAYAFAFIADEYKRMCNTMQTIVQELWGVQ